MKLHELRVAPLASLLSTLLGRGVRGRRVGELADRCRQDEFVTRARRAPDDGSDEGSGASLAGPVACNDDASVELVGPDSRRCWMRSGGERGVMTIRRHRAETTRDALGVLGMALQLASLTRVDEMPDEGHWVVRRSRHLVRQKHRSAIGQQSGWQH